MSASPAAIVRIAERDRKALRLLAAGLSPAEVRERLGLNRRTLEVIARRAREAVGKEATPRC